MLMYTFKKECRISYYMFCIDTSHFFTKQIFSLRVILVFLDLYHINPIFVHNI